MLAAVLALLAPQATKLPALPEVMAWAGPDLVAADASGLWLWPEARRIPLPTDWPCDRLNVQGHKVLAWRHGGPAYEVDLRTGRTFRRSKSVLSCWWEKGKFAGMEFGPEGSSPYRALPSGRLVGTKDPRDWVAVDPTGKYRMAYEGDRLAIYGFGKRLYRRPKSDFYRDPLNREALVRDRRTGVFAVTQTPDTGGSLQELTLVGPGGTWTPKVESAIATLQLGTVQWAGSRLLVLRRGFWENQQEGWDRYELVWLEPTRRRTQVILRKTIRWPNREDSGVDRSIGAPACMAYDPKTGRIAVATTRKDGATLVVIPLRDVARAADLIFGTGLR